MTQPPAVPRPLVLLALLGAVSIACDDSVTQFVFDAQILDGDGGNPAAGTDGDTLRVGISEGELPIREFEYPIEDGQFDATLEFASFSSVTRLRIEIGGATTELQTAPPAFVPVTSQGFLRVVTVAPSSCTRVSFNTMEAPRASFAMISSGTFALVVGGTSSESEQIEFFDELEWESRLFAEDFSLSFLGPTRAATIGDGKILVVPTAAGPFIFDMLDPSDRVTQLVLPGSVGPASALASVPGVGAMIIGGQAGGVPSPSAFLIAPDGTISSMQLGEPRAGAAAVALGQSVLVVGGDATGSAELLFPTSSVSAPVPGVADGVRAGGLLVGDLESRALLIGGTAQGGSVRQDTLRFDDCPDDCVAADGPTWTTARVDAIVPEYATLVVGGEGSRLVDQVVWNGSTVAIRPVLDLQVPRGSAGAVVYESGAFVVGGGRDEVSDRDDFEFCVPAELAPL